MDFNWDNGKEVADDKIDFFNAADEETKIDQFDTSENQEEESEEDLGKEKISKKEEKEEEDATFNFEDIDDDEEEEELLDKKSNNEKSEDSSDKDVDESDNFEKRLEEEIENIFKDMPQELKNLNKYVIQGGNIKDFLSLVKDSKIYRNIDLNDVNNQELVLRTSLEEEYDDEEYINSQIEYFKDSGKLQKAAEVHYKKWEKKDTKKQEELLLAEKLKKEKEKEEKLKTKNTYKNLIESKEEIKGLPISLKEKTELIPYLFDEVYVLPNKQVLTNFQKDLYESLQNEEKRILLAKLLRTNFDFTSIKVKEKTKIVKKIEDDLTRVKKPSGSSINSKKVAKKSLADYLN